MQEGQRNPLDFRGNAPTLKLELNEYHHNDDDLNPIEPIRCAPSDADLYYMIELREISQLLSNRIPNIEDLS